MMLSVVYVGWGEHSELQQNLFSRSADMLLLSDCQFLILLGFIPFAPTYGLLHESKPVPYTQTESDHFIFGKWAAVSDRPSERVEIC